MPPKYMVNEITLFCLNVKIVLFGFVYYADTDPAGFLLARKLLNDTCVIHFAKGKREYKGIFQYMFNHFVRQFEGTFRFYNFEQDLGKINFRKTKRSYDPDTLLKKYRVGRSK